MQVDKIGKIGRAAGGWARGALVVALACMVSAAAMAASPVASRPDFDPDLCVTPSGPPATTLYVWAGDKARLSPDFVAVVDFDEKSPTYGTVVRAVPVPTYNNEAHHMHISADGKTLAAGGLLSLLKGQDDLFFFDISNARNPRYLRSGSAPLSAVTDDFLPLPNGGFLLTNMGSKTGGAPGRVVELDARMNVVREWPDQPPANGFNPHGISARPEINLMVTSDFVNPISTLNVHQGPMEFRNTVRVWDLASRTITKTITVPGAAGTMDVKLIPGDRKARAYTAGLVDGKIHLIDTKAGTSMPVFDTLSISRGRTQNQSPQILVVTPDGSRLILPLGGAGLLVLLDIENPQKPKLLDVYDMGAKAGPHNAHMTHDGKRLVVTDYFLDQDHFGKVHADGDRKVHVFKISGDRLVRDARFNLDFNTAFPTGPARPHGVASK